jgi:hypothetical protein
VHFADFAGLDDEGAPAAQPLGDQVVVNSSGGEECPGRDPVDADAAVGQDDEVVRPRGFLGLRADAVESLLQFGGLAQRISDVDDLGSML